MYKEFVVNPDAKIVYTDSAFQITSHITPSHPGETALYTIGRRSYAYLRKPTGSTGTIVSF
jgi:hypothetical protein